jgi:hypothetical protein
VELGLEVSDFGGGTVLLAAYPAVRGRRPPGDVLGGVVDYLASKERAPGRESLLNDLLAVTACGGDEAGVGPLLVVFERLADRQGEEFPLRGLDIELPQDRIVATPGTVWAR